MAAAAFLSVSFSPADSSINTSYGQNRLTLARTSIYATQARAGKAQQKRVRHMTERRRRYIQCSIIGASLADCKGDVTLEDNVFFAAGISTVKVICSSVYRAPIAFVDLAGYFRLRS